MIIETKYEIGQEVFIKEDGEWWKGEIVGVRHESILLYEIYVVGLYRYFRRKEGELIVVKPEGIQFPNLFTEFDEIVKAELMKAVRNIRKQLQKRK